MRRLGVLAACMGALLAVAPAASAQAPVPCTNIGGGRYECTWWRPGDGRTAGAIVVHSGRVVGYLHQGLNWIICQQQGGKVHDGAGHENHWYGWTQSDKNADGRNEWGWASALDARGGDNYGGFGGGVPDCAGAYGPAPSGAGLWVTAPPAGGGAAPPAPAPPPPPGAQPPPPPPVVDHRTYRPGQRLLFTSKRGSCTAAFALLLNGVAYGLTAGHCVADDPGDVLHAGVAQELLGPVYWNTFRERDVDAVLFAPASGLSRWAQRIDRGANAPLEIAGVKSRAELLPQEVLCFSGSASGADRCGRIVGPTDSRVICIDAASQPGDSGGPVYTRPKLFGASPPARAVGIVLLDTEGQMCFTPIEDILRAFGAQFPAQPAGGAAGAALVQAVTPGRQLTRRTGGRLRFRLARRASVQVRVQRAGAASNAADAWSTIRIAGRRGWNRVRLRTLAGRRLRRGIYRVEVSARSKHVDSTIWRTTLRIR